MSKKNEWKAIAGEWKELAGFYKEELETAMELLHEQNNNTVIAPDLAQFQKEMGMIDSIGEKDE